MQRFPSQWNQQPHHQLPLSWGKHQPISQQQHNISISNNIYDKISAKSKDFDEAKRMARTRIRESCETAVEKIRAIETTLLKEVEDEFSEDPFGRLLERINSGYVLTDDEINAILSMEIPHDFGPDEEMFYDLYKEIESFKGWKKIKSDKLAKSVADTQNRSALSDCTWKECPSNVSDEKKYIVNKKNPRIATKIGDNYCTIICNSSLSLNQITSWSIKIIKSKKNNGEDIYIGIAPFDINQDNYFNSIECGWYFDCHHSSLCSGPPHNYKWKGYGPKKGQWSRGDIHIQDTVGVIMDTTTKGELSFLVNEVNLGIAYEGIPLDKPLVPCVILYNKDDSVELNTSEVKENMDSSIPVPGNIKAKNTTCDLITLTWDTVEGAEFYQIEVDESRLLTEVTANIFTKTDLIPDTEHGFRVRTVKDNKVSGWSDVVKRKTKKWDCAWKRCPTNPYNDSFLSKSYSVDVNNSKIATSIGYYYGDGNSCVIIGDTSFPLNNVISWNIKILESKYYDGFGIFIGVAPSDINQNADKNYEKYGWYYYCSDSTLWSGLPHNYRCKEYGPRKIIGEYVHIGDNVGVIMDTTKGDLSFILHGVNHGVAYEGIPLDKPLVPCALLYHRNDSIELIT